MSDTQTNSVLSNNLVNNHLFGINHRNNLNANGHILENYDDQESSSIDFSDAFVKLSGYSPKVLRIIKLEIEKLILEKIKNLDKSEPTAEKSVYYMKDFSIDKVGNPIHAGETGIAEGWNVPIYKNEYQNLLGLPFTEDHALADSLRMKRPRQECFNCLSSAHSVRDCPIRQNEERIQIHREIFNSQSVQSAEQMNLPNNRYINDLESKSYRGFIPGKISEELRQALGLRSNQLPPFIYIMRELGYPAGWLIEAQVNKTKLAVLNGDNNDKKNESILVEDESFSKENEDDPNAVEYDPNRIYSFPGFNEDPGRGINDEYNIYGVKRYGPEMAKELFLNTLKLEKRKVVGRNISEIKNESTSQVVDLTAEVDDDEISDKAASHTSAQSLAASLEEGEEEDSVSDIQSPKKRRKSVTRSELGASFTEIQGTPIVNNVAEITRVPGWDKFSENICEHKPFEMNAQTPCGSYQSIVKLTKEFKSSLNQSSSTN